MTAVIAAALLAASAPGEAAADAFSAATGSEAPVIAENATAAEILAACRQMMPEKVTVRGHINRRSRHGTEVAAYGYVLTRSADETSLVMTDKSGKEVPFEKGGRLLDTDVTWSDLSMDFIWWNDVEFDGGGDAESGHGFLCKVIVVRNGPRAVKLWVDRRSGAILQAREIAGEKVVREIFCTSLKKFGDRWAPRNIEVGPPGAKYRTKIVVEDVE
jgi:hypothetical protein